MPRRSGSSTPPTSTGPPPLAIVASPIGVIIPPVDLHVLDEMGSSAVQGVSSIITLLRGEPLEYGSWSQLRQGEPQEGRPGDHFDGLDELLETERWLLDSGQYYIDVLRITTAETGRRLCILSLKHDVTTPPFRLEEELLELLYMPEPLIPPACGIDPNSPLRRLFTHLGYTVSLPGGAALLPERILSAIGADHGGVSKTNASRRNDDEVKGLHAQMRDRENLDALIIRAAFPDGYITVEDLVAEMDKARMKVEQAYASITMTMAEDPMQQMDWSLQRWRQEDERVALLRAGDGNKTSASAHSRLMGRSSEWLRLKSIRANKQRNYCCRDDPGLDAAQLEEATGHAELRAVLLFLRDVEVELLDDVGARRAHRIGGKGHGRGARVSETQHATTSDWAAHLAAQAAATQASQRRHRQRLYPARSGCGSSPRHNHHGRRGDPRHLRVG